MDMLHIHCVEYQDNHIHKVSVRRGPRHVFIFFSLIGLILVNLFNNSNCICKVSYELIYLNYFQNSDDIFQHNYITCYHCFDDEVKLQK